MQRLPCTAHANVRLTLHPTTMSQRNVLVSCRMLHLQLAFAWRQLLHCVYRLTHICGYILNTLTHQHASPYSISVTSGQSGQSKTPATSWPGPADLKGLEPTDQYINSQPHLHKAVIGWVDRAVEGNRPTIHVCVVCVASWLLNIHPQICDRDWLGKKTSRHDNVISANWPMDWTGQSIQVSTCFSCNV